jgi:hypothetical protein
MSQMAEAMTVSRGRWAMARLPGESPPRWAVLRDGARLSQREWLAGLGADADARSVLTELLRAAPFRAYRWETPPVRDDDVEAEMALVDSAALARMTGDGSAFAAAFRSAPGGIATFANLSGDAVLVAPSPALAPDSAHLAAFVRSAPDGLIDSLWVAVAGAAVAWLAGRRGPLWVSTAGLGVPWLHVRLDGSPKYYAYRGYA